MKRLKFAVATAIIISLGIFLLHDSAFAQSSKKKNRIEDVSNLSEPDEFSREVVFDLRLHTNGFALAGNYGIIKSPAKTIFFQLEMATLKHPREIRQSFDIFPGPLSTSPKAFIYGKQNSFFALHLGYGSKHFFSQKSRKRGVTVGLSYVIGPSLGFVKPYYLDLIKFSDGLEDFQIVSERYSEENADLFLNLGNIYGASGFTKGFDELSLVAGAHGKVAVHFDWGALDHFVKAIEAGIMIDGYHKDIPIMVTEDNRFLFLNLYISLQLGKRS